MEAINEELDQERRWAKTLRPQLPNAQCPEPQSHEFISENPAFIDADLPAFGTRQ
jgi:hypothetical protein